MLLASSIGQIVHPIFIAFATLLAWFYALIPNYAVAIALLTLTVMIVAFPITRPGAQKDPGKVQSPTVDDDGGETRVSNAPQRRDDGVVQGERGVTDGRLP